MVDRLKELRRLLGLNQGEFAQKIGIKQGSLSDIERGKVGLSNTNIMLICKIFNVSDKWLRNGLGEPFNNDYERRKDLSDLEKNILSKFNLLDDADRKAIESIIDSLYRKTTKEEFAEDNNIETEQAATVELAIEKPWEVPTAKVQAALDRQKSMDAKYNEPSKKDKLSS